MAIAYKITFRLNKGLKIQDKNKPYSIYIRYRQGRDIDFCYSLGLKVRFNEWDIKTQRIKQRSGIHNKDFINNYLTEITTYFESKLIDFAKKQETPTMETIRKLFFSFVNPEPVKLIPSLLEFISQFIEGSKTDVNPTTKRIATKETIKGYLVTGKLLMNFDKDVYRLNYDNITVRFYYDFIKYCEKKKLSFNYIGKHIKHIKILMAKANDLNYTKNNEYQKKEFSVLKEPATDIYLTEQELLKIHLLDTNNSTLDTVKDLFLIGAYTGLRVSDFNKLKPENIQIVNNQRVIKIKAQKTNKDVIIPIHYIIEDILKKRNGQLPKTITPQKINIHIKEIGKLCNITDIVSKEITKGGLKILENYNKYELIKTHTARRSFCTNAYLSGMPTIDIMALSGHTTEKTFLKYIKITPEQRAVKMANHEFFKRSIKVV